jgi:hypothetical protein
MLALILAASLDVWPGLDLEQIPVAIYDGQRTVLRQHPSPPPEFARRGDAYVFEGRHPAVTGNSTVGIGGVETATVIARSPTPGLIAHERFHVHQRTKHPAWSANEADLFLYPVDDLEAASLQKREWTALREALAGDVNAARLALELRRRRFEIIGATAAKYERDSELNEGLATYVQHRVDGIPVALREFRPDQIRDRVYESGLALATLLDCHDPHWRETLETGDTRALDEILATALNPPTNVEDDVRAIREARAHRKHEFLNTKGWTVIIEANEPFFPSRFDPLNVHIVAKGEVLHTRHLQLSGNAGTLEVLDRAVLTEAAGAHPLFNGVKRIVLTGLRTKPELKDGTLRAEGLTADLGGAKVEIVERPFAHPIP